MLALDALPEATDTGTADEVESELDGIVPGRSRLM